jgi:hypothetical protein
MRREKHFGDSSIHHPAAGSFDLDICGSSNAMAMLAFVGIVWRVRNHGRLIRVVVAESIRIEE